MGEIGGQPVPDEVNEASSGLDLSKLETLEVSQTIKDTALETADLYTTGAAKIVELAAQNGDVKDVANNVERLMEGRVAELAQEAQAKKAAQEAASAQGGVEPEYGEALQASYARARLINAIASNMAGEEGADPLNWHKTDGVPGELEEAASEIRRYLGDINPVSFKEARTGEYTVVLPLGLDMALQVSDAPPEPGQADMVRAQVVSVPAQSEELAA